MRPPLLLFFGCCAFAQNPQPQFEVATLKPSRPPTRHVGCSGGPGTPDPSLLQCDQMSLLNLVLFANDRNGYQVVAPDWLRTQVFDLSAKIPPAATREQLPEMMRNLLLERFHLQAHIAPHDVLSYTLAQAKGGIKCKISDPASPALPPAPYSPDLDKDGFPILAPGRAGIAIVRGRGRLFYSGWTMKRLATQIATLMHAPVTDATGTDGKYDIGLFGAQPNAANNADGPTLPQALEEQLGLRLVSAKASVDAVFVDHIDKLPTAN